MALAGFCISANYRAFHLLLECRAVGRDRSRIVLLYFSGVIAVSSGGFSIVWIIRPVLKV